MLWLGFLVPERVFETLSRPYLWSTSPLFGLQTHFGICIVVWVAAARRKKRRDFFGVSPSQKRLNDFQLYSVLVSYLKEIRVACWWWWRSLGKKLCGVNHGKRICMANKTLVYLIELPRERGNQRNNMNDRSMVRLLSNEGVEVLNRCVAWELNSVLCSIKSPNGDGNWN